MHSYSNLFSSESVCSGHPDKLCDRISDAILDAVLAADPHGRVAVETMATADRVIICGEVTSTANPDYIQIARDQIKALGYVFPELDFTHEAIVECFIHQQSPEIGQGVVENQGAGDQGMMFGFANRDTENFMPLPIMLAHSITRRIDEARENGALPYLYPDGKCQVTVRYDQGKPVELTRVVAAVPHQKTVPIEQVKKDIFEQVIKPAVEQYGLHVSEEQVTLNGTGVWNYSGPAADTGLTGRKIVVDTYGGYARVGGGALSGKDPSKVDRSGAYAARFIAKNLVAAGYADAVEVSLAYCIGQPQPVMKNIETFGTEKKSREEMERFVEELLDCSVQGIISGLDLRRPIYSRTAAYGHFGGDHPWEQVVA